MTKYSKYVGLDVHKADISVGIAPSGRTEATYYGVIESTPQSCVTLAKRLSTGREKVLFCYEAGPCGYEMYRALKRAGYDCEVIAPALIPKRAGNRVKTDRRDAVTLARLLRAGELTPIWVPEKEQEAMRDLTRLREDMKAMERHLRQKLGAFLLRHGKVYRGRSKWTQAHFRWLEGITFDNPTQQIVFQEYVDAVIDAKKRVRAIEEQMRNGLHEWSLQPVVQALMSLRGIEMISAVTIVAELGDTRRFETARQFMAYLGLVPSEHSSGGRRQQGGITKTGNGHVRRVLVEAAWCYRFPARKSAVLQRRAEKVGRDIQDIAWKAQKRLCSRYRYLLNRGKRTVAVCAAVARELAGFIWAIVCDVMDKTVTAAA